jgi:vitamin B12 transporter
MKKFINLSLGLSLVPFFALSSVNAQEPLNSAEGSPEIEEILVSASLIPIAASRSANAITVIDSEQIKLRAATTVSDLLRDVPGLAVGGFGSIGSLTSIRARGAEANHLVVLIDGIEVNDPSQDDQFNWGTLSSTQIERIEVIRGPQSTLQGSDAIAGIINIVTSEASEPFSVDFYSEYGNRATSKNGISVGHSSESLNVSFGASHFETDGINAIPDSGDDIDGHQNTGANLRVGYKYNDQLDFIMSARSAEGTTEFDNYDDDESEIQFSDFNRLHKNIKANYISSNGLWSHIVSLGESDFENNSFMQEDLQPVSANGSSESSKQNLKYVGSRFWDHMNQRLSVAIEREEETFKQTGGAADGVAEQTFVERDTDSIAVEYRFDYTDSVTLAASARHDDNDATTPKDTHRLEAVYQYNDNINWRAAWGTAVKNPTFTELYGIYARFTPNPNLKPEESSNWELGIDGSFFDKKLKFGATYFDSRLVSEIKTVYSNWQKDSEGNWSADQDPINLDGESKRKGLELSSALSLTENLLISGAYTYTRSFDSYTQKAEINRAKNIGSLNFAWQPELNTKFNVNMQYNGSQEVFGAVLEDYILINFNATKSVSDKMDLYININNLSDTDYDLEDGYATLGRSASLGLRYKLH